VKLALPLKRLLLASNLGLNKNHPLAGWQLLTILYHDGGSTDEVMTVNTLATKYNTAYLDVENNEAPISDSVLKGILTVLEDQARLIESSSRKVRQYTQNGLMHILQSHVYKITSSGIEYLTMMQRVVDAENTVTANINRIDEFCDLVQRLAAPDLMTDDTQLANDFQKMITAYSDVMKGMHKLDDDLGELTNDLAFNHGSAAAEHLQAMLSDKAIPAFKQLLAQGDLISELAASKTFSSQVATSQQGDDDLDAAHAVGDQARMYLRFQKMQAYVERQLAQLALSFNPSASAIDSSLDTVYLLFNTILEAIQLLSQEYDHIQGQTVDIKALTADLDRLLAKYQDVVIPAAMPRHLAQDRLVTDPSDLLNATAMGPIAYAVTKRVKTVATAADNPAMAADEPEPAAALKAGLAEFQTLVMRTPQQAIIDHDLEFETQLARDEVARLYSATGYDHYDGFAPFGRAVKRVTVLPSNQPICLHYRAERYSVWLPSGFKVEFEN